MTRSLLLALLLFCYNLAEANTCGQHGVWLQVLGSGGPELMDGRASSSYLIVVDGKARVLVDAGSGSVLNFEKTPYHFNDLQVILFTHFHVDHSAELPAYIKGSYFLQRQTDLPLFGPDGNEWMPGLHDFLQALFGPKGAYRYLGDFLPDGGGSYHLQPHELSVETRKVQQALQTPTLNIQAISVHHGPLPALAWRVQTQGRLLVFSGDMNGDYQTLPVLARNADLLIAHNAIPEQASGVARKLHMPPSVIGAIAAKAQVKNLLLSHRMLRTLGQEAETTRLIRQHYAGPMQFADDLTCIPIP